MFQQVLYVGERIAPEEVGVPVRGFAIEVIVTNGQAGRGASPIKSERDHSAIFRRIRQA